jgi:predicted MFS family arabinose efflux permease
MRLLRRLWPLYIGTFLQGLVFWYAIEKLFMTKIGFDSASIGLSVAIYSAAALLTEIPSGILADRWSRKGVLILSSITLATSSLIGALSNDVFIYLIASAAWGIFTALNSGTIDSIIYDTLLEENGNGDKYEREMGKIGIIESIALIIGSIFGGTIGQFIGLRQTYWLSIPTILLSIIFLWLLKEPKLYMRNQDESLLKHISLTFGSVFKNKNLVWILISLIATAIVWTIVMEMWQVWLIALIVPVILFGPINAFISSIFGLGGILSHFIKSKSRMFISTLITLTTIFCLIFSRNVWLIILAIFILMMATYAIDIVLTHKLHDNLTSKVRVGSSSAINSVRRLLIIPVSLFFGAIANGYSIFTAGWLLAGLIVIAAISLIFMKNNQKTGVNNV